jgi:hypothetical protein
MEPTKRPRGRPPTPEGAKSQAEVQRAYRERQKARTTTFDPDTQVIMSRDRLGRSPLQAAKDEIAYLKADRDRWYNDCLKAEADLKLERQFHLNTTKDKIVLQKELATLKAAASQAKGRRIKIT